MCQDGLRLQWPERSEKGQKEARRSEQSHRECISSRMECLMSAASNIFVFFQARIDRVVDGNGSDVAFTTSEDSTLCPFPFICS